MTRDISKFDDIIDSRDVIERIEELQALQEEREEAGEKLDVKEAEELAALLALQDAAGGYSEDWTYGATLIRNSYFKEYAQELADDIGAIPNGAQWPCYCIDWDYAARELQMDYTAVEFDGVTYWVR